MSLLVFSRSLHREETLTWELVGASVTGPQAFGGMPGQSSRLDGGPFWRVSFDGIAITTAALAGLWDSMEGLLDGGVTPVVIERCGLGSRQPWPLVDGVPHTSSGGIPFSDGAFFSDGTGFYQPVIQSFASAAAILRATSIIVRMDYGVALRGTEHFTIDHPNWGPRLYRVLTVTEQEGGLQTVTIRPPLREAIDAETILDFDKPRCVMRLKDPSGMRNPMQLRRFGRPSPVFEEYPGGVV